MIAEKKNNYLYTILIFIYVFSTYLSNFPTKTFIAADTLILFLTLFFFSKSKKNSKLFLILFFFIFYSIINFIINYENSELLFFFRNIFKIINLIILIFFFRNFLNLENLKQVFLIIILVILIQIIIFSLNNDLNINFIIYDEFSLTNSTMYPFWLVIFSYPLVRNIKNIKKNFFFYIILISVFLSSMYIIELNRKSYIYLIILSILLTEIIYFFQKINLKKFFFLIFLFIICSFFLSLLLKYNARFDFEQQIYSFLNRLYVSEVTIDNVENIFIGEGPGTKQLGAYNYRGAFINKVHNLYIELFYHYGAIGLAIFFLIVWKIYKITIYNLMYFKKDKYLNFLSIISFLFFTSFFVFAFFSSRLLKFDNIFIFSFLLTVQLLLKEKSKN